MIAIPNKENDMGVYIKDVQKPKACAECELWSLCFYPKAPKEIDDRVMPDCPLEEIDLVRCKECKNSKSYTMNSNLPTSRWCHRFHVPVAVEDDDYCSYAERRTDERITE